MAYRKHQPLAQKKQIWDVVSGLNTHFPTIDTTMCTFIYVFASSPPMAYRYLDLPFLRTAKGDALAKPKLEGRTIHWYKGGWKQLLYSGPQTREAMGFQYKNPEVEKKKTCAITVPFHPPLPCETMNSVSHLQRR